MDVSPGELTFTETTGLNALNVKIPRLNFQEVQVYKLELLAR